jgi:hypothetical protein
MTIGIFKEWLVKYFFVHSIVLKAEGTESADITTNENILLLDEYSKVKLF